jgi:RNA polymerase sigma-70 factor (ECF subfamily)
VRKVYESIESLSPRHQTIVKLSFLQGLSTAEIAAQMELSENHVRAERSRALSRLRETLSNQKLWGVFLMIWATGLPLQKF